MDTWRDLMCGEPRADRVGETLTLSGWAARRRDHGGLVFVDLRDRTGILQLVINPEHAPEAAERAKEIRNEFVLRARGDARGAHAGDGQSEDADRRGRVARRRARARLAFDPASRSSSTRRTSTRRCACATAGSTFAARSSSATSGCERRWSGSSAGTWSRPGSSTSRRRSSTSRPPRAPATSSFRAVCTRGGSSRCRRALRS